MTTPRARLAGAAALAITGVIALCGCQAEYHGHDSGIDGVMWRQVAGYLDPIKRVMGNIYEPYDTAAISIDAYLALVNTSVWEHTSDASALGLESGGAVLYDVKRADNYLSMVVFVSSGPRPEGAPTDSGSGYAGPGSVYTCFSWIVGATDGLISRDPYGEPGEREALSACDSALVATLPDDAAFASIEVFDG